MPAIHNLDTSGMIITPQQLLDRLIDNFVLSDKSQTIFYDGKVESLRYEFSKFDNDSNILKENVQDALSSMLARYFPTVNVIVDVITYGSKVSVAIEASVIVNGKVIVAKKTTNNKELLALYESK